MRSHSGWVLPTTTTTTTTLQGFIVSAVTGSLKVCHLPYKERLDTHWALKKVSSRCRAA
jgi:hypothetical protein